MDSVFKETHTHILSRCGLSVVHKRLFARSLSSGVSWRKVWAGLRGIRLIGKTFLQ